MSDSVNSTLLNRIIIQLELLNNSLMIVAAALEADKKIEITNVVQTKDVK